MSTFSFIWIYLKVIVTLSSTWYHLSLSYVLTKLLFHTNTLFCNLKCIYLKLVDDFQPNYSNEANQESFETRNLWSENLNESCFCVICFVSINSTPLSNKLNHFSWWLALIYLKEATTKSQLTMFTFTFSIKMCNDGKVVCFISHIKLLHLLYSKEHTILKKPW